jgi:hypothetical protein
MNNNNDITDEEMYKWYLIKGLHNNNFQKKRNIKYTDFELNILNKVNKWFKLLD